MAKPLLLLLTLLATASADSITKKARSASDVSMKALRKQAKMHMDAQAGARRLSTTPAPSPGDDDWDDDDWGASIVSPRAPSSPSPSTYRE